VLVSLAAAIALGATSMSAIALPAHLAPVLGDAPSGPTVRRAQDLAGTRPCNEKTLYANRAIIATCTGSGSMTRSWSGISGGRHVADLM
jgi:hypothetical protein